VTFIIDGSARPVTLQDDEFNGIRFSFTDRRALLAVGLLLKFGFLKIPAYYDTGTVEMPGGGLKKP
jgi:hypothetical protein